MESEQSSTPQGIRGRDWLHDALTHLEPSWLDSPSGHFGSMWVERNKQNDAEVDLVGIKIAQLYTTGDSKNFAVLARKIKGLIRRNLDQYIEDRTEIFANALFVQADAQTHLEPFVPFNALGGASEPPGPDAKLVFPNGKSILLESTVIRSNYFERWARVTSGLRSKTMDFLSSVDIADPIGVIYELPLHIPPGVEKVLLDGISPALLHDFGGAIVYTHEYMKGIKVHVTQPDDLVFQNEGNPALKLSAHRFKSLSSSAVQGVMTDDRGFTRARMCEVLLNTAAEQDLAKEVHRALTQSLRKKRRQWPHDETPLVLATSFTHTPMGDYLESVLEKRVWNNPTFSWLSGIMVVNPTFEKEDIQGALWINDRAAQPVPSEFRALFQWPSSEAAQAVEPSKIEEVPTDFAP